MMSLQKSIGILSTFRAAESASTAQPTTATNPLPPPSPPDGHTGPSHRSRSPACNAATHECHMDMLPLPLASQPGPNLPPSPLPHPPASQAGLDLQPSSRPLPFASQSGPNMQPSTLPLHPTSPSGPIVQPSCPAQPCPAPDVRRSGRLASRSTALASPLTFPGPARRRRRSPTQHAPTQRPNKRRRLRDNSGTNNQHGDPNTGRHSLISMLPLACREPSFKQTFDPGG